MPKIERKKAKGEVNYLKVELDSGVTCILRLHGEDENIVSPSLNGNPTHDQLREACRIAENNGYTVNLDYGLPPKGFEYPK